MELNFDFTKYTEVTELAFKVNPQYQAGGYTRIFICEDTHVFWISRILKDVSEDYEPLAGNYLVERNQIDKINKGEKLTGLRAIKLLKNDEFDNWDFESYTSLGDAIESIDGGYGILCLQGEQGDDNG